MRKPIHPDAQAAANAAREEATKYPTALAKDMAGSEEELEAEAMAQYAEELRRYVQGFAFSDIPCWFLVPGDLTEKEREWLKGRGITPGPNNSKHTIYVRDRWRNPEQWGEMRAFLLERMAARELIGRIPKGWSYAKLVGDRKPERFDLANPRIYTLTGRQVPWSFDAGWVGKSYAETFTHKLVDTFHEAPANEKRAEVVAYLEHHRTKGGNPQALADLVDEILQRWKVNAPTYLDPLSWKRLVVPRHAHLLEAVEEWLKMARKAPPPPGKATTSAMAPTSAIAKPKPFTLKDKLGQVPGALERFMGLVSGAGLCYNDGRWITAKKTKGSKSKLIAAWDAIVKVDKVSNFDTDAALIAALKGHFDGLEGLEAPHKVRTRWTYKDARDKYVEELEESK